MTKHLVRQNINFLEYPLWFQDDRFAEAHPDGYVWRDLEGYEYRTGYKVPVKTDAIFLLYLLLQCQKNEYSQELHLTRYQIIRECGLVVDSKWYDRLEDSLKRWKTVSILFAGNFYDGNSYQAINFGVIDSWSIHEETKELKIVFSPSFIQMMLGKGFFKYINFAEFKQLRSSLATRLYEILIKSYHGRDLWEIEALKLAEKIPMKERYPAHIVPKIRAAVNRINKNTTSVFEFSTRTGGKGSVILSFRKLSQEKTVPQPHAQKAELSKSKPPSNEDINRLVLLLPPERQKQQTILEIIIKSYGEKGFDYVARNIAYANKYAKRSYRPYLQKTLKLDYGRAMVEDEELKKHQAAEQAKISAIEAVKAAEESKRQTLEDENRERARAYISSLSEEARSHLERQALATLDDALRAIVVQRGPGWKTSLRLAMERIALTRLSATAPQQHELFSNNDS